MVARLVGPHCAAPRSLTCTDRRRCEHIAAQRPVASSIATLVAFTHAQADWNLPRAWPPVRLHRAEPRPPTSPVAPLQRVVPAGPPLERLPVRAQWPPPRARQAPLIVHGAVPGPTISHAWRIAVRHSGRAPTRVHDPTLRLLSLIAYKLAYVRRPPANPRLLCIDVHRARVLAGHAQAARRVREHRGRQRGRRPR